MPTDVNFDVHLGDALKILPTIPTNSVSLIFVHPPSTPPVSYIKSQKGQRLFMSLWDTADGFSETLSFHRAWIAQCARILKDPSSLWVSGSFRHIYICGYLLQEMGFKILNDICWYIVNSRASLDQSRYFPPSHNTLIWAKLKFSEHTFHKYLMKDVSFVDDFLKGEEFPTKTVWAFPRPGLNYGIAREISYGMHPQQQPEALLERILLATTNKHDLVLDPFMGTGVTGVACAHLQRRFIGIEQNSRYVDIANARITLAKKSRNKYFKELLDI